jgi:hypothetical protein
MGRKDRAIKTAAIALARELDSEQTEDDYARIERKMQRETAAYRDAMAEKKKEEEETPGEMRRPCRAPRAA